MTDLGNIKNITCKLKGLDCKEESKPGVKVCRDANNDWQGSVWTNGTETGVTINDGDSAVTQAYSPTADGNITLKCETNKKGTKTCYENKPSKK